MNWIKGVTLVFASIAIAVLLVEFVSRIAMPQNLSSSWRVKNERGLVLNKSDGSATQQFFDRNVTYSFGPPGVRTHKSLVGDGSDKVLVVGDSFTFGWLLDDKHTYVYKLDEHYDDQTFINAAAGGWGSADYASYIEQYCSDIKPTTIFIIYNISHIERAIKSSLYRATPDLDDLKAVEYHQTNSDKIKAYVSSSAIYNFLLLNSNLLQVLRHTYVRILVGNVNPDRVVDIDTIRINGKPADPESVYKFAKLVFVRIMDAAKRCGADLRMAHIGIKEYQGDKNDLSLSFLNTAVQNKLFDELNITFKDLSQTNDMIKYRGSPSEYTIEKDGHPNEMGADLIFRAIRNSGILE